MQTTLEAPASQPETSAPKYTKPFSSWPAKGRPAGYYNLPLPDEAVAFYKENGFLVVENCISPEGVTELRDETTQVCRGNRGAFGGIEAAKPGFVARTFSVPAAGPHGLDLDAATHRLF